MSATEAISYGAPVLGELADDRLEELGLQRQRFHLVVARFEPENHVLEIVRGAGERRLIGHSGGFPGHITRTLFDPVDGLTVVGLTNAIDGPARELVVGVMRGQQQLAGSQSFREHPVPDCPGSRLGALASSRPRR